MIFLAKNHIIIEYLLKAELFIWNNNNWFVLQNEKTARENIEETLLRLLEETCARVEGVARNNWDWYYLCENAIRESMIIFLLELIYFWIS